MVVAVALVGVVQPPAHEVIDVIAVRHGLVSAVRSVLVVGVARGGVGVTSGMCLVDRDHVLVDVVVVGVVQVAVVEIVDVIVVMDGGVPATRSVLVRVGAFVYLVSHAATLRRRAPVRKTERPESKIRQHSSGP